MTQSKRRSPNPQYDARTFVRAFWQKVDKSKHPCWVWTAAVNSSGRPIVTRRVNGKNVTADARRIAFQMQNGSIPTGLEVTGKCGNKLCVRGVHLFCGTRSQVIQANALVGKGPAKVTPSMASAILALRRVEGLSAAKIKERLQLAVSERTVLNVIQGTYTGVPADTGMRGVLSTEALPGLPQAGPFPGVRAIVSARD